MNRFLKVMIIWWLVLTIYNLFFEFSLIAVIVELTWLTMNLLMYQDYKNDSIYPKKLSKRKIKKLIKQMPERSNKYDRQN